MARHRILRGLVQVYRRGDFSRYWQCSASINGKQYRASTNEEGLPEAKSFAEDWYLTLRGKSLAGVLKKEKTFAEAADQFLKEYPIITEGQRSPLWVKGHEARLRLHLVPFFGALGVSEVTPGKTQEYRVHRNTKSPSGKSASRSTLHDEIVTLRLVLKTAVRHGWLTHLPDLSAPYRTQGKIQQRPWFTPEEYIQLYTASRAYTKEVRPQHKWFAEQTHDYILFLGNTGMRPDEVKERNLEHRDIKIVDDPVSGKEILEISIRGKRGVGFCKSMPGAVEPYRRLLERARPVTGELPKPTDAVFPGDHKRLFNGILNRTNLKLDREGTRRTAYSLRHTYICMRLMQGADIYALAKNCRTSVEMIQKFYASHIKDLLDASVINVMRSKTKPRDRLPHGKAIRKRTLPMAPARAPKRPNGRPTLSS